MSGISMRSLLLILLLFTATVASNIFLSSSRAKTMDVELHIQLPSPQLLEKLSLGYQNFLANILWIETIAYYGGAIEKADYNYIQRLLSAIIQLNPNAEHAYYLADTAIPWQRNRHRHGRPDDPPGDGQDRSAGHSYECPYFQNPAQCTIAHFP